MGIDTSYRMPIDTSYRMVVDTSYRFTCPSNAYFITTIFRAGRSPTFTI
jgi:hypothetical protein